MSTKITLTVTVESAQAILDALGTKPYNEVALLQADLRNQAQAQIKATPVAEPTRPKARVGRPVKKVVKADAAK